MLTLAGLWLGGSWGMRQARRAGQAQGHAAFRLTEADRTVGSTPTPPPSRRRDHLLSLPWVIGGLALGLPLASLLLPGLGFFCAFLLGSAAAVLLLLGGDVLAVLAAAD